MYLYKNITMEIVNYTEARNNFKQVLDRVSDDCDSTLITRRDHEDVVLMAKSEYDSWMETIYLLRSPANAKHLTEAIARVEAGKFTEHELLDA